MLKLKLQYFGHLMWRTIRKVPDAGKGRRQEEKGTTENKMVGWHHQLNGHELEQTPGDGEGKRRPPCCNPWIRRVRHAWEWTPAMQRQSPEVLGQGWQASQVQENTLGKTYKKQQLQDAKRNRDTRSQTVLGHWDILAQPLWTEHLRHRAKTPGRPYLRFKAHAYLF